MSEGLLYSIEDFLSNRKFAVKLNDVSSDTKDLDVGCVQGSILGPKLFSLYVSDLAQQIGMNNEIRLVWYADDTCVLITSNDATHEATFSLTESTLQKHILFLRSICMLVNKSKTEVMWIGKCKPERDYVNIGTTIIKFLNKMKALGLYIEGDLSWDAQANHAIAKSKKLLSAFRFLRKYLNESQFLKAAAATYSGMVFYACSVWFHNIKQIFKTKLTSVHFRILRCMKKDYMMKFKQNELTELCQRATPEQ
jgi:ribonuclease P/MRP protein subunit RPP40